MDLGDNFDLTDSFVMKISHDITDLEPHLAFVD